MNAPAPIEHRTAVVASLSASAIAESIRALELALDLDHSDWVVEDLHLWPLYRMELYRLFFADPASGAGRAARPRVGHAFNRPRPNSDVAARPHKVWLVSDGISFADLSQRQFERFCGALYLGCRDLGVPAVVIDRGSEAPRRSAEPTRWWAPLTQRAKIVGLLAARLRPDARHHRLLVQLRAAAALVGISLPSLQATRLDAMSRAVLRLADRIETKMRAESVSTVFVVGYYDVGGYAYVLAASRVGALSIDVQHGVTGALHMGYADWRVAPRPGLKAVPQCFWTWTANDAAVVEQWGASHHPARRAVVGGNPFLSLWRNGGLTLPAAMSSALGRLVERAGDLPKVLVTLQPNVTSPEMLGPLLEAWKAEPRVMWWMRLHPLALHDRADIEAMLRAHSVAHWDIDAATSLPLPALLAQATVHATHSSSVFIEAELLGVRSIVWSVYGAELVPDLVDKGRVRLALSGREFIEQLNALSGAERHVSEASDNLTHGALRTLLDLRT